MWFIWKLTAFLWTKLLASTIFFSIWFKIRLSCLFFFLVLTPLLLNYFEPSRNPFSFQILGSKCGRLQMQYLTDSNFKPRISWKYKSSWLPMKLDRSNCYGKKKRQPTNKQNKKATPKKSVLRCSLITRSPVNTSGAKETKTDSQAINYLNQPLKIMTTVTIMSTAKTLVQFTDRTCKMDTTKSWMKEQLHR